MQTFGKHGFPSVFGFHLSDRRYWAWGLLLIITLFASFIRFGLLEVPLERDEGEFAYAGQLILQGILPYLEAYNMKLPGTYAAYALIMAVFGETVRGIHFGLLLVNVATIILVFLLGRRLLDNWVGVVAATSYALLSAGQVVMGVFAHSTHFVVLPALGGVLLLLSAIQSGRSATLFWSGLLVGLAFLMKQHGIFFVIFSAFYLTWSEWRTRSAQWSRFFLRAALFSSGAMIPFGLTCAVIYAAGGFERFWFWTFKYASEYVSQVPFSLGMEILKTQFGVVASPSYPLWVLSGIGGIVLYLDKRIRPFRVFVIGFALFSFLAICPGFYFRGHYFILMLPALSLLGGIAISSGRQLLSKCISPAASALVLVLFFISVFGYSVFRQRAFFFEFGPYEASRMTYGSNPFPESLVVANYIKAHSAENDRVAVLGSEPQIFFYSDRRSATGYIYMYGLMEDQKYALKMQEEMIREIEAARPAYLIFVNVPFSWLARSNSQRAIFDWANRYVLEFERVGMVEILISEPTRYLWDSEAEDSVPSSPNYLLIFKRRPL